MAVIWSAIRRPIPHPLIQSLPQQTFLSPPHSHGKRARRNRCAGGEDGGMVVLAWWYWEKEWIAGLWLVETEVRRGVQI